MSVISLTAYVQMSRARPPVTGVGKHIINGVLGMAADPEFDVTVLTSRRDLDAQGKIGDDSPLHVLPARGFPLPLLAMERLWKLTNLPKADRWCGGDDWLWATAEAHVPVKRTRYAITVNDIHAFEPDLPWSDTAEMKMFRRKWAAWLPRTLRAADLIITISQFSRQRMVELLGVDERKIAVVGCGAEAPFYEIAEVEAETVEVPVDGAYLLVIGGLTMRKGGGVTLDVAEALAKRGSELRVVVAGRSEAAYGARAKGMANVIELGVVADELMPRLVRRATALLFLSRYEGFGIPAIEAMAAGTPAIVSRHASLPEVVGEAGLSLESNDAEGVASAAAELLRDEGTRAQWARLGRAHAEQYRWERYVERLGAAFGEATP